MNEAQLNEGSATPANEDPTNLGATLTEAATSQIVVPAQASCPRCNGPRMAAQAVQNSWVYVIGDIDPRYPSLAVEKEVLGAMARADTAGLSNDAALQRVLAASENAFLVREMCWVLRVQEVETYILRPSYSQDFSMLVEAARTELSAVIGTLGPVAPPEVCNGLTLPFLIFDVIYNFDRSTLVESMPIPDGADAANFRATATGIFNRMLQLINNGTGMERALAFELMRDDKLYHYIANEYSQNAQLTSVEVKAAPGNSQNLVDVVVKTLDRRTLAPKSVYARIALANKLPYMVTPWQPRLEQ